METLETAIATAEDAQAKAENELIEYAIEQKKREEVRTGTAWPRWAGLIMSKVF